MNMTNFWAAVKAVLSQKDEIKQIGATTGQTLEAIVALIQSVMAAYLAIVGEKVVSTRAIDPTTAEIVGEYTILQGE